MSRRYRIILADPPWKYASRSHHSKTRFGGGVSTQYPTMTDAEILAMGPLVTAIAEKDAALLLWATMPRLPLAVEVIKAWGFRYATAAFVWEKVTKNGQPWGGPGTYTASNIELLLLGVRGKMPPVRKLKKQVIRHAQLRYPAGTPALILPDGKSKRMAGKIIHSAKPEVFREAIVEVFGDLPRVELFCRRPAEGWDAFGNQLDGMDIRESLVTLAS